MAYLQELQIALPQNLENLSLPAPELVNYWRLAENRIFYIEYEIDEAVNEIQKAIVAINIADKGIEPSKRKKIILMLNTPGGLLSETMMLVQTILASTTPVVTVNMNMAYSGGFLLLIAGHERYAFKYARAMCHTGSGGVSGTFEQTEAQQKVYKQQVDEMGQYLLDRTNVDEKLYKRNKSKDWYLDNAECINLGIIDKEIKNLDEII